MILSIVRYVFVGLGLLFFLLGFLSFKSDVGPFSIERLPDIVMGLLDVQWDLVLFFFVLGYLFFIAGIYWKSFFRKFASFSVFVAVFLMTFAIFLYPIYINSSNIADSIQPTIDYMAADLFDDVLNTQVEVYDGDINLMISQNSEVLRIYVSNITVSDANYLTSGLGMNFDSDIESLAVSKMIITSIYEEIQINSPEIEGVPIPLSQIEEMASSEVDLSVVESVDVAVLESVFEYNDDAYIDIIVSEGVESFVVNPSSITDDEVEMLWDNLGLNSETSFESKRNVVVLLLSASAMQMEDVSLLDEISIPIDMLKHAIPEDVVYMMGTEIMSDNVSQRVDALQNLREFCDDREINDSNSMCAGIMMTDYETLMNNLQGESGGDSDEMMLAAGISDDDMMFGLGFDFEEISTIDKVEGKVESLSSSGVKFFWFALGFIFLACILMYVHYKINSRLFGKFEVLYQVSKMNFISYISTFVFIVIVWYFIGSDFVFNLLADLLDASGMDGSAIEMFKNLPIYQIVLDINSQVLIFAILYFVVSSIVFGVLYFLNKKYPSLEHVKDDGASGKPVVKRLEDNKNVKNNEDIVNGVKGKGSLDKIDIVKNDDLNGDERKAKLYIEKYKNDYSKDSLKEALVKAGMASADVEKYLDKYC